MTISGGVLELTDRGKAARRIDVKGIDLEGNLGLRDLASSGSLTLGTIDVAAAGHEPLRGSSLTAGWKTRGETGTAKVRLLAKEAGLDASLDAEVRDLWGTPAYTATLTTEGTLGPLAARLAPDLGLGGRVEARVVASGKGSEPPSATATIRAEALTLLGRTFDRVDFAGDVAGALLRKGTLDATAARGASTPRPPGRSTPRRRTCGSPSGPSGVDLARLLVLPAGAPRLAGMLDGTVVGTLARPEFEGITASADLAVSATGGGSRGTLAPNARARLSLAGGVVTVETAELSERRTTASLQGIYDHRQEYVRGPPRRGVPRHRPLPRAAGLRGKRRAERARERRRTSLPTRLRRPAAGTRPLGLRRSHRLRRARREDGGLAGSP